MTASGAGAKRWLRLAMLTVALIVVCASSASASEGIYPLHGVIRDGEGKFVSGASVGASPVGASEPSAGTTTNAQGEYSLPLPEGRYDVHIEASVGLSEFYDLVGQTTAKVDGDTELDFDLPKLGTVTITVLDANGSALPNAGVSPTYGQQRIEEGIYHARNQVGGDVYPTYCTTDANGQCTFEMLPNASVEFTVDPPSGLSFTGTATASIEGATAALQAPRGIYPLHGVIRDGEGKFVSGASVGASPVGASEPSAGTTTNAQGEYSLPLPEGRYDVHIEASVGLSEFYDLVGQTTAKVDGDTELDFDLPKLGTVTITVLDANGSALPNAGVSPTYGQQRIEEGIYHARNQVGGDVYPTYCTTDANGQCTFEMLPNASVEFTVDPPSGLSFTGTATASIEGATAAIQSPYIHTHPLHGVIRDGEGKFVSGASVGASPVGASEPSAGTTTNAQGEYSLPLPEGRYDVHIEASVGLSEFYDLVGQTTAKVDGDTELDFDLPKLGTVTITVLDANGSALPNAGVSPTYGQQRIEEGIYHARNQVGGDVYPTYCTTDANGQCTFEMLPNASVEFTVDPPSGLSFTGTATAGVKGRSAVIRSPYGGSGGASPTVISLSPKKGSPSGGEAVTIRGKNLTGATGVKFGASAALDFTVESATAISADVPPGVAGSTAEVTVANAAGSSLPSTKAVFTYERATISTLSPDSGPIAGGTRVTITGAGFATGSGGTGFVFGKTPGTDVSCSSSTMCTVLTPPAKKAEVVDVRATVAAVKGKKAPATDQYTYQ